MICDRTLMENGCGIVRKKMSGGCEFLRCCYGSELKEVKKWKLYWSVILGVE